MYSIPFKLYKWVDAGILNNQPNAIQCHTKATPLIIAFNCDQCTKVTDLVLSIFVNVLWVCNYFQTVQTSRYWYVEQPTKCDVAQKATPLIIAYFYDQYAMYQGLGVLLSLA